MRHRIREGSALAMALLTACAGCATAPHMDTPSGRPEVTIDADTADTRAALESEVINRGFMIIHDEGPMLLAEKDGGLTMQIFAGNSHFRPQYRLRFNLVRYGERTRVVGMSLFTHALYSNANEAEITNPRELAGLQYLLDCVKADAEHQPRPPAPELPPAPVAQSPRAAAR